MSFRKSDIDILLAKCQRRCCVCHKFCGVKMELHHIQWKSKKGTDNINNAIPLCFECHAEVNHYNPDHPKGRKFSNNELLEHKKLWLETCEKYPAISISAPHQNDIGPLEGMLLELEFNLSITERMTDGTSGWQTHIGCALHENEYMRAVKEGSLVLLPNNLRQSVNLAYSKVSQINTFTRLFSNTRPEGNAFAEATNRLLGTFRQSTPEIKTAFTKLETFLTPKRR